jgi:hypothetical protein
MLQCCQDEPVGGGGDAVKLLGLDCSHNLRQADHAGEAGPEPSEQLRNHPSPPPALEGDVTSLVFRDIPGGFPDAGASGPMKVVNWLGRAVRPSRPMYTGSGLSV